jgi:F420-non-reducing hydrogenase small subunit
MSLDQIVDVDYSVPGCPPTPKSTNALLDALFSGKLPAPGSVIGANSKSVCDECDRDRKEKRITRIKRPHLDVIDPVECLLDQGFLCCGPATRGGCTALCPTANMPCIGCYGPLNGVEDYGAKMLSVVASVLDHEDKGKIDKALEDLIDPAGYFNKFSGSKSLLFKKRNDLIKGK